MSVPLWAVETADDFWKAAGSEEPFPRTLRRAVAFALPLAVVALPRLRLASIDTWLREQDVYCRLDLGDRPLRACLVARYGQGLVFLDGSDFEDEQRFSLAHEVAHFLKDYWRPRHVAVERLGPRILEVLDGERPPRHDERVHALLARVPIGFHIHLMERTTEGQYASAAIDTAERDADLLACELLAPSASVLSDMALCSPSARGDAAARLLRDTYGLPQAAATLYASLLVPRADRSGSFLRRLGVVE